MSNKPFVGFPLTLHSTGQYCKRIRGKLVYFGNDWQLALDRFINERDELYAGRIPQSRMPLATVGSLVERFLASRSVEPKTHRDYERVCHLIRDSIGSNRPLESLTPEDFSALREKLESDRPLVTAKGMLSVARMLFLYAADSGLCEKPLRYRKQLQSPSAKKLRREKAARGAQMFEAKQILALADAATPQMKAMIYLGINCAFGPGDCSALPWSAVSLDNMWHNFSRPKTGNDRRCPLWPETVEYLKAIHTNREFVFQTKYRQCWTTPSIGHEFRKLLDKVKIEGGFYNLRRTFATIAGCVGEESATKFIMGHIPPTSDMGAIYRQRQFNTPLLKVVEYVRQWLAGVEVM